MKVILITETNSDLTVVNAARCSFAKQSEWSYECTNRGHLNTQLLYPCQSCKPILSDKDTRLIQYLVKHEHWTPFAHPQEAFSLSLAVDELLYFFINANLSGFEWVKESGPFMVRGSLYAWLTNAHLLPSDISCNIVSYLLERYPISTKALWQGDTVATIVKYEPSRTYHINSGVVLDNIHELRTATLCIEAPIFVKRQLETHRRGFVMTDIEDWSQNEVSRRYVDTTPEVYEPEIWRVQSLTAKQGSDPSQMLAQLEHRVMIDTYRYHIYASIMNYDRMNRQGVAHEQSRMILPLATYTTFWWTASAKSWKRLLALRLKPDVQSETRELCQLIADTLIESGVTV